MRSKRRPNPAPPPSGTPCFYCSGAAASGWDHLIPVAAGGGNDQDNLVPSCLRCNQLASSFVFLSVEEKRTFVVDRLSGGNGWDAVSSFRLLPALPMPSFEQEKPEVIKLLVTKKRWKTLEEKQARVTEYWKTYQRKPPMPNPTESRCRCCGQPVQVKCAYCGEVIPHPRISPNPERSQKYCCPAHRLADFRMRRDVAGKSTGII